MSVSRLANISKIGVEQMGDMADSLNDPDVLRLENLDTDIRPPAAALACSRAAIDDDDANSYLPFFGQDGLRQAVTGLVATQSGQAYDWKTESLISAGGLSGVLNTLLAVLEPGDKVLLTDPTYAGLINRVRLAGGEPQFLPLIPGPGGWRLDRDALAQLAPLDCRALLLMSPSMPSGAVFDRDDWRAICQFCQQGNCWLINDTAMERILFDGRPVTHPASMEDMRERVITVGSASKEYRMIGWRVGWVVGPASIVSDVARVSISNVVCQTGIAMGAVEAAIRSSDDGISAFTMELQQRRDLILAELRDFIVIPPHGGWSMLVDVSPLGIDGPAASALLLEKGKIAATPMIHWGGERTASYIRLVFSNEPMKRLAGIGERFHRALG